MRFAPNQPPTTPDLPTSPNSSPNSPATPVSSLAIIERTHTCRYETSLFGKLSLAYIFNSVLIPIGVGSYFSARVSGVAVTQAWFEPGGVVNQAVFLIVTNGLVCVLQVLQPWELFKRFVLARSVVSQVRTACL